MTSVVCVTGEEGGWGGVEGWMNRHIQYNNDCRQVRTTVYGCGRGLRWPVGVGWCACDKTSTISHVHAHLVGFGGVCRVSVHYAQCFRHYRTWGVGSTAEPA